MIAILFIKEYSQRISEKNIRNFHGKPLLWWIIDTLYKTQGVKEIVIDTDSDKIVDEIKQNFKTEIELYDFTKDGKKLEVLKRPKHLLGHYVTANDLIKGIIDRIEGEHFLQTHVTNPLLKSSTIEEAISHYYSRRGLNDSLFAVTEHKSPFYTAIGEPINHDPDIIEQSQNAQILYEDNSNLYIFSRESFGLWGRVGLEPFMFPISKLESIDINTEEDWAIAEAVKENLNVNKSCNTSTV